MTVTLETTGFGTNVLVIADESDIALPWLERWISEKESTLSRFDPTSELCRLNARAGQWVQTSPLLWELLEVALVVSRATGGLVTPTVLNALVDIGYDRSFWCGLDEARAPDVRPREVPSTDCVELDVEHRAVRLPEYAALDLGGFAKGYLAEALADEVGGPVLVDLGGDIAVRGPRLDGTGWVIETPPHGPNGARLLLVDQGGIATSGMDRRRWSRGGQSYHHLIDPRTGGAASSDLQRATVVAPTVVQAEAAAKLALLLGMSEALTFVAARPELEASFLAVDGGEVSSAWFERFVWESDG